MISPAVLQAAAIEARNALHNGWQEASDCPHCINGSVTRHGSMWWQTRVLRCSYCQGTGLAYRQATSNQSPSSVAGPVERPASIQDSSQTAQGARHE
jgi:ribosomal protein L37AE/L43A